VGAVIYVVGGQSGQQLDSALNNFWSLDISLQNDTEKFHWQELQSLPTHPRAYNMVTHQRYGDRDCVYVLGGRAQVDDQVRFLKDVWRFDPRAKSWQRCEDLPRSVTAGIGIGWGEREIYVLGGDDGLLFAKTDELRDQHPGFRKEALAYDTATNVWTSAGATPQNQVTTIPVIWNNSIIVASGEVRPRVRTPAVWSVKILPKK
jgi:N-acetylneuraminic acid mutarotase